MKKARRIVVSLFGAAVALQALILVMGPYRCAQATFERIDLAKLERRRHVERRGFAAELPRFSPLQVSDTARLCENGVPLANPDSSPAAVAAIGSGHWCIVAKETIHFSSSDGTDPLRNGRRYELVVKPNFAFTSASIAVALVTAALGVAAWALGGLQLRGASSMSVRVLVLVVTAASLGAGLTRGWDRVLVGPDAPGAITHSPVRTPLYPSFIDLLDKTPGEPRTGIVADQGITAHASPDHRLVHVAQAQKILTVLAIVALVFELTCGLNAWLVGALAYAGVLADLLRAGPGSVHFDMNVIGVEGLDHALVIFFLAVTFAYLRNPTGRKGALVALLLTLLVANHPSNAALSAVFVVFWALHVGRGESYRQATMTTAGLAFVFALPLAVHVAENARATGRFELAVSAGSAAVPLAVQVASPEDVQAFHDDPALRDLAQAVLVDNAKTKIQDYNAFSAPRCLDANLRANVVPAFAKTIKVPQGQTPEVHAEGIFREVSRRLIARHGDDYAVLVARSFAFAWDWTVHGALVVTMAIAGFLYARTRAYELLFVAAFAALPLIALVPACAVGVPTAADRAGLGFAEPLALGLLATTLWTLGRRAFDQAGEEED